MREIRPVSPGPSLPETWKAPYYDMSPPTDAGQEGGWDIARKLWRRKWLVAGVTFLFVLVGGVFAAFLTPRYTAETRLLIGVPDPQVANIEAVLKTILPNAEITQSEAYVIGSREVAQKVAYRLALDKSPEFNPALPPVEDWRYRLSPFRLLGEAKAFVKDTVRGLLIGEEEEEPAGEVDPALAEQQYWDAIASAVLNRVEVTPLNRSHVLGISAESEEPATAARIANAIAEVYIEQQLTRKQRATDRANEWLQTRIKELQDTAQRSERAVEEYRRENGLYETRSDTVIGQQLAALNQDLVAAESDRANAQAKLAQAQSVTADNIDSLPAVLQSPLIINLRGQLAQLESHAAELSSTYTAKHPRVRDVEAQLTDTRQKLRAEVQKIARGLQHEAAMAQDRYNRVSARMDQLMGQMGQSNEKTVRLNQLEREAEANRTMLQSLLQRSKETASQQEIQTSNAEIISRATVPLGPSFPPTTLILLLATLAGAGCAVLVAFLVENLDRTFRTADEVEEYTGLPSLALVPTIKTKARHRPAEHVVRQPHSPYTGSLRMLNARLTPHSDNPPPSQVLMFTSSLPGEGKSRISSSFSQLMAAEGQRVIVLDLDWKRPSLHRMFNQPSGVGLADLLNGDITPEQAVYRDPASGVHALFAGNVGRMPGNAAWVERLRLLLYTLSRHYDLIVLDTSPCLVAPEVLHLARLADRIVLVVKWASTPKRVVSTGVRTIYGVGGKIAGVVLSQVNARRYQGYGFDDAGYLHHRYLVQDAA